MSTSNHKHYMKKTYAFFDIDGTIIYGKSMFSFHEFWYHYRATLAGVGSDEEKADIDAVFRAHAESGASRERVNDRYYGFFAGRSVDQVSSCAEAWARRTIADPTNFIAEVVSELHALQFRGIEPVFISGSFTELLAPVAAHLGVDHLLAMRLCHANGRYTGRYEAPQTIGLGKAEAIVSFLDRVGGDMAHCHAYGDDLSDMSMLQSVGHPVAVIGSALLGEEAAARGWRCLQVSPRVHAVR